MKRINARKIVQNGRVQRERRSLKERKMEDWKVHRSLIARLKEVEVGLALLANK